MIHPPASDDAFDLLAAIRDRAVVGVDGEGLYLHFPGDLRPIRADDLTDLLAELEALEWVANDGERVTATERGLWQLRKWESSPRVRRAIRAQERGRLVAACLGRAMLDRARA